MPGPYEVGHAKGQRRLETDDPAGRFGKWQALLFRRVGRVIRGDEINRPVRQPPDDLQTVVLLPQRRIHPEHQALLPREESSRNSRS